MDENATAPVVAKSKRKKPTKRKTPSVKELKAEIARLQAANKEASKSQKIDSQALLAQTVRAADWKERETKEERMDRIMSDPLPKFKPEPVRDYPTTEQHYIVCVDEAKANKSMPIPKTEDYLDPETGKHFTHKLGNFLVSDRALCPAGWIRMPTRGSSISVIEKDYPAVFKVLKDKGVVHF